MTFSNISTWVLRLLAAIILLQTLFFKFTAAEESVYIFTQIGMEPWGRIGIGIMELIAALLILYPKTTPIGALLAIGLMAGAIFFHLTKLGVVVKNDGGQLFVYALIVLVSSGVLVLIYRQQLVATAKSIFKINKARYMQLQQAIQSVFVQISESLEQLTCEQYCQPSKILFGATIGQHVRHIIELFICLDNGYNSGVVNYEKRKRDLTIETDKNFAASLLKSVYLTLDKTNKDLLLEATFDEHSDEYVAIETNYFREIAYNLEHTVHHMALIRVGITEVSNIEVPNSFGVAASTIKYRQSCAQ